MSNKLDWHGTLLAVQPRIRLQRSFDQRSHGYLGYVLQIEGTIGDHKGVFSVGIGQGAQAKHKFRAGDAISGRAELVADPKTEPCDYYKASGLKVIERTMEEASPPPPWTGVPPELPVYRELNNLLVMSRSCRLFLDIGPVLEVVRAMRSSIRLITAVVSLAVVAVPPSAVYAQSADENAESAEDSTRADELDKRLRTNAPEMEKLQQFSGAWTLQLEEDWKAKQNDWLGLAPESRIELNPTRSGRFLIGDIEFGGGQIWFDFHLVFGFNPLDKTYRCTIYTPVSNIPVEGTSKGPDEARTWTFSLQHSDISDETKAFLHLQLKSQETLRLELSMHGQDGDNRQLLVVIGTKAKASE